MQMPFSMHIVSLFTIPSLVYSEKTTDKTFLMRSALLFHVDGVAFNHLTFAIETSERDMTNTTDSIGRKLACATTLHKHTQARAEA